MKTGPLNESELEWLDEIMGGENHPLSLTQVNLLTPGKPGSGSVTYL
jgi:hypothetical protein